MSVLLKIIISKIVPINRSAAIPLCPIANVIFVDDPFVDDPTDVPFKYAVTDVVVIAFIQFIPLFDSPVAVRVMYPAGSRSVSHWTAPPICRKNAPGFGTAVRYTVPTVPPPFVVK